MFGALSALALGGVAFAAVGPEWSNVRGEVARVDTPMITEAPEVISEEVGERIESERRDAEAKADLEKAKKEAAEQEPAEQEPAEEQARADAEAEEQAGADTETITEETSEEEPVEDSAAEDEGAGEEQYADEEASDEQYAGEEQYGEEEVSEEEVSDEQYAEEEEGGEEIAAGVDPGSTALALTVPKMGLYGDPVVNDVSEGTLMNGAGKIPSTGFPWQEGANTYIASHVLGYEGTGSYLHFAALPNMSMGDEVILTDANGTEYRYAVSEILTVPITDVWVTNPVAGRDMVSLQTCINPPAYDLRLVVRADRVS